MKGVFRLRGGGFAGQNGCRFIRFGLLQQIVSQDMFQKKMEGTTMVVMTEMTEFVQKDIVAKRLRKPHDIEVEIDIVLRRAASPVGGIMLYRHLIIYKAVACGELGKTRRKFGLGLTPQDFYFSRRSYRHISR